MDDKDEFLAMCEEIKRGDRTEIPAPPPTPKPPPPKIELTQKQKRLVIDYCLGNGGSHKGLFEDCEEMWEGIDDPDEAYPSLRDAVDEFIEESKQRLYESWLKENGMLDGDCHHPNAEYYGDTHPPTFKCPDCGAVFVYSDHKWTGE